MSLQSYLPGPGQPRRLRRLVVRWANLANILALRRLSTECARRFPTFDRLVQAGGALCSVLSNVCAGGFADWAGAAGAGARPPLLRLSLPSLLVLCCLPPAPLYCGLQAAAAVGPGPGAGRQGRGAHQVRPRLHPPPGLPAGAGAEEQVGSRHCSGHHCAPGSCSGTAG